MLNGEPVEVCLAEAVAWLKDAAILTAGLDDEDIEKIAAVALMEERGVNSLLTREDERSRDLFIVVKGAISVEVKLAPHDTATVSILKIRNGGVVGELSFLDGGRRSATLKAVVPTTILRLPHSEMEELFVEEKGIGLTVMRNLAKLVTHRLRSTNFELRARLP